MNKNFKRLLSFVFIFLLSFVGMNKAEAGSYHAPGTLPSRFTLVGNEPTNKTSIGKVTEKAVQNANAPGRDSVNFWPDADPVYTGAPTYATRHPSTTGENFICLEKGIAANWGDEYTKGSEITGEVPKIIAFALNSGYDDITVQAMVWQYLGQVDLNQTYQRYYQNYLNEKAQNPNSYKFKGVRAYNYYSWNGNRESQRLAGYEFKKAPEPPQKVLLRVEKDEKLTLSNNVKAQNEAPKMYDLDGAVYGVFGSIDDAKALRNPIQKLTLKYDSGNKTFVSASVKVDANKSYYVKEISNPKGYTLDPNVYTVHVKTSNVNKRISDIPLTDPIQIMVRKKSDKSKPLAGAEFEISYFNELMSKDQIGNIRPTRTWKFKTDSNGFVRLNDSYKIGGDDLYKSSNGTPVGLKGTYLIRETKAPKGYKLDTKQEIRHITGDQNYPSAVKFENNPVDATNIEQVGKISIEKIDKETRRKLTGIKFDIKLVKDLGETDIKPGTVVDTLTMGEKEESKELPLGLYEIVERRDSLTGRGYQIMQESLAIMIEGSEDGSKWADYNHTDKKYNQNLVNARAGKNSKNDWVLFLTVDNNPQKGTLTLIKEAPMLTGTTTEDKFGYKVSKPRIEKRRLAGTKWQLIADEDIISKDGITPLYKKGQVVETLTTTTTSTTSKEHPLGKYILKEVDSPKQYTVDLNSYDVTFNVQNPEVRVHLVIEIRNIQYLT